MENEYKYDVAFSFLSQDENIALKLENILKGRLSTFVYGTKQEQMMKEDGDLLLIKTYKKESRIVVILYRNGWGKSDWTAVEERAIKERGFEMHNYNFLLTVMLEQNAILPEWMPKTSIKLDYRKYGLDVTANTIEVKVQESGGEVKILTVIDKARKCQEEQQQKANRKRILESAQGVEFLVEEYRALIEKLNGRVKELVDIGWTVKLEENKQNGINIFSQGYSLIVHYHSNQINSLTEGTYINFQIYSGYIKIDGDFSTPYQKQLQVEDYVFDINEFDQKGWIKKSKKGDFYLTQKVADLWIEKLIDRIKQ